MRCLLTGTPAGVGLVKSGDVIKFTITGIGTLESYIK
ncbi:fumarylacetoacetate hydrolase family protein [Caldanaerobius fijiensis]